MEIGSFLFFVVLGLATWRVSSIIAYEDDLFGILTRLREAIGLHWFDQHDRYAPYMVEEGTWRYRFGELVSCLHCNSVWVGIGYTVFAYISTQITLIISLPFALSAIAVIIKDVMDYGESDDSDPSLFG